MILSLALAALQDPLAQGGWRVRVEGGTDDFYDADHLVQILDTPVFTRGEETLRASWAVLWIDRSELADTLGQSDARPLRPQDLRQEPGPPPLREEVAPFPNTLFDALGSSSFGAGLVREVYLEGPIEYYKGDERVAYAGAVYLDLIEGHGWIADVSLTLESELDGDPQKIKILTDWLRHSANGTLEADDSVVTTCDFDVPHLHLTTGELVLEPAPEDSESPWLVSLRKNAIHLFGLFKLPLPTKNRIPLDESGRPDYKFPQFGDSARFGSFVGTSFSRDLGRTGRRLNEFLGGDKKSFKADGSADVSYLGSRGLLVDLGLDSRSADRYWWDFQVAGIDDDGRDRGFVRVDRDDREDLRFWYRSRGRLEIDDSQWIDVVFSSQTDPGVQSEFYEREYLRFEERQSFVHWRRARGTTYLSATAKKNFDSFRTETEELPAVDWFQNREQVLAVFDQPVLYTGASTVGNLRRLEGDPEFDSTYADGLGERDVIRADTRHRLEMPIPLGFLGLRATPWTEVRGTAWDEGVDEDDSPARLAAIGGLRLATTFWRRGEQGLHELTPSVAYRNDIDVRQTDGTPVRFDRIEDPLEGRYLDLSLRSIYRDPDTYFDVEITATHADGLVDSSQDGWQPLEAFASLELDFNGRPITVFQEGRYDFDESQTNFSYTAVGWRPREDFGVEASHQRGIDQLGTGLFEAASIGAIWRWTPKWEFEAREQFSILEDGGLGSRFTIRRFGHDLVFDVEIEYRAGEGTSFSIGIDPVLTVEQSRLGLLKRWRR